MQNKVFKTCVTVQGDLYSSFVFQDDKEARDWVIKKLPKLEREYGKLKVKKSDLPGFKVGQFCNVYGEGKDTFKILDLVKYSEDRYGFLLDNGCTEEVAKCHDDFIN